MWKLIILSTVVAVVQTDLQKFYGTWTPVMVFPNLVARPLCLKYAIYKDPINNKCTCSDSKRSTPVIMELLQNMNFDQKEEEKRLVPILEVTKATDVMPAMNVSCTCGVEKFQSRVVARSINKEYFILYELQWNRFYPETEQNTVYIVAKNIESSTAIQRVAIKVDDLSQRRGGVMCAREMVHVRY